MWRSQLANKKALLILNNAASYRQLTDAVRAHSQGLHPSDRGTGDRPALGVDSHTSGWALAPVEQ